MSLGRFLELTAYNDAAHSRFTGCGHSLHFDHERYVGCGTMVRGRLGRACAKPIEAPIHTAGCAAKKNAINGTRPRPLALTFDHERHVGRWWAGDVGSLVKSVLTSADRNPSQ